MDIFYSSSSRNLILNAIPAIGTHTAVRFLKEKFVMQELTVAEAAQALMASVHMVTPDVNAIQLFKASQPQCLTFRFQSGKFQGTSYATISLAFFQSFFDVDKIFRNPVLRQVVMLGYGTLVSKYCVENSPCSAEHVKVRITQAMTESQL